MSDKRMEKKSKNKEADNGWRDLGDKEPRWETYAG